jgi:hypothetical protein
MIRLLQLLLAQLFSHAGLTEVDVPSFERGTLTTHFDATWLKTKR